MATHRKLRSIVNLCILMSFLLLPAFAMADECRLFFQLGYGDNGTINNEDFNCLVNEMNDQTDVTPEPNDDGWGLAWYAPGSKTTGQGYICTDGSYNIGNRWADNLPLTDPMSNQQFLLDIMLPQSKHIVIAHIRKATNPDTEDWPDPHPFIYTSAGRSISFVHNGVLTAGANGQMELVTGYINNIIAAHPQWPDDPQLTALKDHPVDSARLFGLLIAHIKAQNYDILRGLRAAMIQINNADFDGAQVNFILTDGNDVFAYRFGSNSLEFQAQRGTGQIRVFSHLPATVTSSQRKELANGELVYIMSNYQYVRFGNFNTGGTLNMEKPMMAYILGTPYDSWESFPVLRADGDPILTMVQDPATGGSGAPFSTVNRLTTQNPLIFIDYDDGTWEYGYQTFTLNPTLGYKLQKTTLQESTARVKGNLVSRTATVTLQPGQDNWVGYWLANSQTLGQALGSKKSKIQSVAAQNWYWSIPAPGEFSQAPNFPMEFGKMYNIRLKPTETQPVSFTWYNSRTFDPRTIPLPANNFSVSSAPEYAVLEIQSVEDGEDIEEIGLFAGDTCIGATGVEEFPVQLLYYPQGYEGLELEFQYYTGAKSTFHSKHEVRVWNSKTQAFQVQPLVAGELDRKFVTLSKAGMTQATTPVTKPVVNIFPNPFNPETRIGLSLPIDSQIEVVVYNIKGQKVRSLINGRQSAGTLDLVWNGRDEDNRSVASGVYFCRITCNGETTSRKMLLVK